MSKLVRHLLLLATVLAVAPAAQAEVVQEVDVRLTNIKSYGAFTVIFSTRTYDSTGVKPPALQRTFVRLPAGAKIAPEFLKKRTACDVSKLKQFKDLATCAHAQVGQGTAKIDARPYIDEEIPAHFYMYLARGSEPGAVASFAILGIPDAGAPVVASDPTLRSTKVVLPANIFRDPTPDGRFGYRIEFPTRPIPNSTALSIASINGQVQGKTLKKRERTCAKRTRGRCARYNTRTKRIFWIGVPTCPVAGFYPLQAVFSFENLTPIIRDLELPCPRVG